MRSQRIGQGFESPYLHMQIWYEICFFVLIILDKGASVMSDSAKLDLLLDKMSHVDTSLENIGTRLDSMDILLSVRQEACS